jgi:gliding motility-associated-like protein
MKTYTRFKHLLYILLLVFSSHKTIAQCFDIESILVAACAPTPGTEGYNEMVRFKVGAAPINTGTMSVNWPAQAWQGLAQNAVTAGKVAAINAAILAAGGCGQLVEPTGGVLPANAEVILITSYNFTATANVFGAISQNIYVLFQDNAAVTGGHFGNYNATPGTRTLTISFGACSDTVTYERSLLANAIGATANFTPSGTPSYTNPGCVAPVEVFSVDAGTTPVIACPGATISLSGTAVGQTSVNWTAPSGSFSAAGSLATHYTVPLTATGSIVVTLTATNPCGTTITDDVTINVTAGGTPIFTQVAPICTGTTLTLPNTSTNGIIGIWSPALDNTATTTYTFTPNAGQCASSVMMTIVVNAAGTIPTFNPVTAICAGDVLPGLPATSTNGITGVWSPALNNMLTTVYTFLPNSGQCAIQTTLTITVNQPVTPTFTPIAPICTGFPLPPLPTTSLNGITGTWSPPLINTATTTYTFTPNAGQCATNAPIIVTVNPANILPVFTPIAPICPGSPSPLPAVSSNGITGTWSPAFDNTTSMVYFFTPDPGQCAVSNTIAVTITPPVAPTFNPVATICSGSTLAALPTTSTNGINGVWAPALNNILTTIYTFTPNAGQCASNASLTITVTPISVLNITNNNATCNPNQLSWAQWGNITSNTATGTIGSIGVNVTHSAGGLSPHPGGMHPGATFPPQFDVPVSATTIRNDLAGLFTFCFDVPVTNPQVAFASIGSPTQPVQINTSVPYVVTWQGTDTTYPTNQSLIGTEGFTIITFPGTHSCITFDYLASEAYCTLTFGVQDTDCQISPMCQGQSVTLVAHGATNYVWSPATGLNTTLGATVIATPAVTTTYTVTSPDNCTAGSSITVTVKPNVTPTFNPVPPICTGATLAALPTTSTNGISGAWSPALNNTATTLYTFTPTAGQCAPTTTMSITVNTATIVPTFNPVAAVCSGATLLALPTTSLNGILGAWSPALNNTLTTIYTFTPNAGQCALTTTLTLTIKPIITPLFNPIAPICSGAALAALPTVSTNGITGTWSPALNNTLTTVYTFTPTVGLCAPTVSLTITVNQPMVPTFAAIAPICSGAVLSALPTTSTNGIAGTWSPALNNLATTIYTFTPTAGQCATTRQLTITVNQKVTPTFNAIAPICPGATLAALPTTSTNGIAGTWSPSLNNAATTLYTFLPNASACAVSTILTITVLPANIVPTFTPVATICAGASLGSLPTISLNGITGTWSPALTNTTTRTYTFIPNPGQCGVQTTLTITVNQKIIPAFNTVAPICAGDNLAALPTTSTNGIAGTWSPALNNTTTTQYTFTPNPAACATTATMIIFVNPPEIPIFNANNIPVSICSGATLAPLPTISTTGITGTWSPALNNTQTTTYTYTPDPGQCATTNALSINVEDNAVVNQSYFICFGDTGQVVSPAVINTGLSAAQYSFVWSFGGSTLANTGSSYTAQADGVYTVLATNLVSGCTTTIIADVQASNEATAFATVGNDFDDVQQIVVTVIGGLGVYEYQLDNGPFQTSNIFHITQSGDFTIHIRDNFGCNNFELHVTAINFPKFFTPNGDGYNDLWNVWDLPDPNAVVYIFDRYGKLIKEIAVVGKGWDGLYNDRELPATDYWFKLLYQDKNEISKEFRSHFSLKR